MNTSNFDNFDLKHLDELLDENKAVEFENRILPVVVTGHGVLQRNRFVKVPENYIIITFQRDGYLLGIDYGRSKQGIERKCKNPNIQFLYFWIHYLQYCTHLSAQSEKDIVDTIKENIHVLNEKIKKYRQEIEPLFKNSVTNTFAFYPNDLIAETKFSIQNDKTQKIRLGITDWKTMLSEGPETCFLNEQTPEFRLDENHLFSDFERAVSKKKTNKKLNTNIILLSELLNFMSEKTGLSTKTRHGKKQKKIYKVLFLVSCRGYPSDVSETFILKPWIEPNPFKHYLHQLQKLEKYKPQIDAKVNQVRETVRNLTSISKDLHIRLLQASVFLYNYFFVGNSLIFLHHDVVGISFGNVTSLQKIVVENKLSRNHLLNVFIPISDSNSRLVRMNSITHPNYKNELLMHSYYVPPNIVGYVVMKSCFSGSMKKLVDTIYYDMMWNEKARLYIFEKWVQKIEPYLDGLTRSKKFEYISNMRKIFVYKKEFRKMDTYNMLKSMMFYRGFGELFLSVPEVFNYTLAELEVAVLNYKLHNRMKNIKQEKLYLKFPFINKKYWPLWTAVYNYSLLLKDFPYETPFEFAFANYRWVDDKSQSVINNIISEPSANEIYIEGILDLYRSGNRSHEHNFHGKVGIYRDVIYKIIIPLQKILITYNVDEAVKLENVMSTYSYKMLISLASPASITPNFVLPKDFLRYIETFDGLDVIYGKFLMDQLNYMISKTSSTPQVGQSSAPSIGHSSLSNSSSISSLLPASSSFASSSTPTINQDSRPRAPVVLIQQRPASTPNTQTLQTARALFTD